MLHPPRGRAWFGRDDGRSVRTPMVASQGRREAVSTRVACALDPREYFLKPLVGCRIVHISADVADAVEQSMRDVFFNCADGKVAQSVCQIGAKRLVGPLAACYADDQEGIRQQTFRGKIVECRHEEAVGQVARRAENDEAARLGRCGRGRRAPRLINGLPLARRGRRSPCAWLTGLSQQTYGPGANESAQKAPPTERLRAPLRRLLPV